MAPGARSHAQATGSGTAATASHASHGPIETWRRRARKNASSAARIAGSRSEPTTSRTLQSVRTLRSVTMPFGASPRNASPSRGPAPSIAPIAPSEARPNAPSRFSLTSTSGPARARRSRRAGPRQPLAADRALLGDRDRQRAPGPLPERPRTASMAADLTPHRGLDRPFEPERRRRRRSRPGPWSGFLSFVPAMSPSTITPSTGPPASWRAHAWAPPKPCSEPEVETSTIVFSSSRDLSTRASSSSTAVPDGWSRRGA